MPIAAVLPPSMDDWTTDDYLAHSNAKQASGNVLPVAPAVASDHAAQTADPTTNQAPMTTEDYLRGTPSGATPPGILEWPGVIGRTFVDAAHSDPAIRWARNELGLPPRPMGEQEPAYRGVLGYMQKEASSLADPFGVAAHAVDLPAAIMGNVTGETLKQAGASEGWQEAGEAGVGLLTGATEWKMAKYLASRAVQPAKIADDASKVAGITMPTVGRIENVLDATGQALKDSVSNAITSGTASTAKGMKTLLNSINSGTKTASDAMRLAIGKGLQWGNLPTEAQAAIKAFYAKAVDLDPDYWLDTDPQHLRNLFTDPKEFDSLTTTAMATKAQLEAKGQNLINRYGPQVIDMLKRHWLERGAVGGTVAGMAHAIGGSWPGAEIAGAAAMTIPGAFRTALRHPQETLAGVKGAVAGEGRDISNLLQDWGEKGYDWAMGRNQLGGQ